MTDTETDHFEAGLATLSADATHEFDSSAPWKINGVAIPVNTIVNGGQNVDHFFPPEVLEDAGKLLEGVPIVKNFHELEGQASADEVIGQVNKAGFQKGVGLVFDGEITDREIAEKIAHGFLDVSPTPARSLGPFDESMGAQKVDRLVDFRDIAVVANGQPGAKVEIGSNPTVGALAADVLSRGFDTLQSDGSLEVSGPSPDSVEFTDTEWDGSDATAAMPNPSESEDAPSALDASHLLAPTGDARDDKSNWKLPIRTGPDAPVNTRALVAAKAALQGARGGVEGISLELADRVMDRIDEFLTAAPNELFGVENESAESDTDTQSDDPETASSVAEAETTETMSETELTDEEKAVLTAADDVENAKDVLNAYSAAEQPEIVESDVLNKKDEQLEELASVFRDALADKTGLSEDTVNAMPVDALANEFRNEEGEIEAETLSQKPETQTPSKTPDNQGESAGLDALSRDERKEVKNKLDKIKLLNGRVSEAYLDSLKSEAADLANVESADEINYEAL